MDLVNKIKQVAKNNSGTKQVLFKDQFSLEVRKEEAQRVRAKYPDRVPVIVEPANGCTLPMIDKKKYLVPEDLSVAQFLFVVRKRIKLKADEALFLFVNNILPPANALMSEIYRDHKDPAGFVTIVYNNESTFGK